VAGDSARAAAAEMPPVIRSDDGDDACRASMCFEEEDEALLDDTTEADSISQDWEDGYVGDSDDCVCEGDCAGARRCSGIRPFCSVDAQLPALHEMCTHCFEDIDASARAWRLPCAHLVHDDCVSNLCPKGRAKRAFTCPICCYDISALVGAPSDKFAAVSRADAVAL